MICFLRWASPTPTAGPQRNFSKFYKESERFSFWFTMIIAHCSTEIFTRISWSCGRPAEGCEKVSVQLNKTAANICDDPGEKKIFVKYLPREGLVCQIFCFLLFFSARSNCSVYKISDSTNQPFMAFSNNFTNIQIILQKKYLEQNFLRFWNI